MSDIKAALEAVDWIYRHIHGADDDTSTLGEKIIVIRAALTELDQSAPLDAGVQEAIARTRGRFCELLSDVGIGNGLYKEAANSDLALLERHITEITARMREYDANRKTWRLNFQNVDDMLSAEREAHEQTKKEFIELRQELSAAYQTIRDDNCN